MPELPEVETVRRGLAPAMEGARIARVELRRADLRFPFAPRFAASLEGARVRSLGRRAKYLLIETDRAHGVIAHLGMSGSFRIEASGNSTSPGRFTHERSRDERHDHVVFHVEGETGERRIIYNDPRRFGFMHLVPSEGMHAHASLHALGIEPTGNALSGDALARALAGRAVPLKNVLMDQRLVAGLGNIYVCEALWRARLSPRRSAATLVSAKRGTTMRAERLAGAIREVIADAISAGGSTLRDHRQADGTLGYFQNAHAVYDREGEPCPREGCGGTVRRIVQGGRSTFFCAQCQR